MKPTRDPDTKTGRLETGKRVHEIHGTLKTGLQDFPRSLVAPQEGAGGFIDLLVKASEDPTCPERVPGKVTMRIGH